MLRFLLAIILFTGVLFASNGDKTESPKPSEMEILIDAHLKNPYSPSTSPSYDDYFLFEKNKDNLETLETYKNDDVAIDSFSSPHSGKTPNIFGLFLVLFILYLIFEYT
jgi:hypothetical protein